MNIRFSNWLNKEILPRRKRAESSPLARKARRVSGVFFLSVLCSFAIWRVWLYHDVNRRLAQIRAAGLPANCEEMNAWYQSGANAENGALRLTKALHLLRTFPDSRSHEVADSRLRLIRTNQWAPATRQLVEAYVQTNAPAIAKAWDALKLSYFRYPIDFHRGWDTKFPHHDSLREMARISALLAALNADAGNADEWPKQVEFDLKLASTLDGEPTLSSYWLRISIICTSVGMTERSLNRTALRPEMCNRLQQEFILIAETNVLPRAIAGDRAMIIPMFDRGFTGFFERDLDFYLQTMEKAMSTAALPLPQCLMMTNDLNAAFETASNRFLIFSDLALFSVNGAVVGEAHMLARARLASTALAVEGFRQDQRELPNTLEELVPRFLPGVPIDPFDGKPLRYRRVAKGYVVYSVGADGHDDGGRERPERTSSNDRSTYDITFVVER